MKFRNSALVHDADALAGDGGDCADDDGSADHDPDHDHADPADHDHRAGNDQPDDHDAADDDPGRDARDHDRNHDHSDGANDDPDGQPATTTTQTTTTETTVTAATADDLKKDVEVYDQSGGLVGKIDLVKGDAAIVNTGKARAEIPVASFGKNEKGLVVAITKADIDAQAKSAKKPK